MNSTPGLIPLLTLVLRLVGIILVKAAESEKAGNLEALQAAVVLSIKAQNKEEAQSAAIAIREAFKKR